MIYRDDLDDIEKRGKRSHSAYKAQPRNGLQSPP